MSDSFISQSVSQSVSQPARQPVSQSIVCISLLIYVVALGSSLRLRHVQELSSAEISQAEVRLDPLPFRAGTTTTPPAGPSSTRSAAKERDSRPSTLRGPRVLGEGGGLGVDVGEETPQMPLMEFGGGFAIGVWSPENEFEGFLPPLGHVQRKSAASHPLSGRCSVDSFRVAASKVVRVYVLW